MRPGAGVPCTALGCHALKALGSAGQRPELQPLPHPAALFLGCLRQGQSKSPWEACCCCPLTAALGPQGWSLNILPTYVVPWQAPIAEALTPESPGASVWRSSSLYASWLLLELVRDSHAAVLKHWAPHAAAMEQAINTCLDSARVQQPGEALLSEAACARHGLGIWGLSPASCLTASKRTAFLSTGAGKTRGDVQPAVHPWHSQPA